MLTLNVLILYNIRLQSSSMISLSELTVCIHTLSSLHVSKYRSVLMKNTAVDLFETFFVFN